MAFINLVKQRIQEGFNFEIHIAHDSADTVQVIFRKGEQTIWVKTNRKTEGQPDSLEDAFVRALNFSVIQDIPEWKTTLNGIEERPPQ